MTEQLTPNERELVALLRREGCYGNFWFGDDLLKAANLIERKAAALSAASEAIRQEEREKVVVWTPWHGEYSAELNMPAIDTHAEVTVLRRDGRISGPYCAGRIEWHHEGRPSDIMFWRESNQHRTNDHG